MKGRSDERSFFAYDDKLDWTGIQNFRNHAANAT